MIKALAGAGARLSQWMVEKKLSRAHLARLCVILLVLMLIPLVLIAPYNYPADDDFQCALPEAKAWLETGSLPNVIKASWDRTVEAYNNWQGNFVSTFFFGIIPIVFDIHLYFLSNWFMLALLCLSLGYLVKGITKTLLGAGQDVFWIVYVAALILILQFMPAISQSVYWHNGGMYTAVACTLMQTLGLLIRANKSATRARSVFRGVMLALCGFMLGGSFFGPMLGALVLVTLITIVSWARRMPNRIHCMVALAFFLLSCAFSLLAPGNALRQERTGETMGILTTVITAALDSFDLTGNWLSPQLFAMLMLILPTMWKPLKESSYSFRHPFWVFVMLYGLMAASLAPGIYTGFGYTTERYINVVYFYFVLMALGSAVYAEGALIRLLERQEKAGAETSALLMKASVHMGERFCALYLAFVIALTCFGGFSFTIMNTSSLSAAKSLVTGEAAKFRQDMAERQEYIRVTDSDVTAIQPLDSQPYVFKADKLPFQGIYGRVRYMKWYFELFHNTKQGAE